MDTPAAGQPTRIVLVALDTLGDHVLRQPLLSALLTRGHAVTVVARQGYEDILPYLDSRLQVVTTPIAPHTVPEADTAETLAALAARIEGLHPDVIVAGAHNASWADEWLLHQCSSARSVGFIDRSRPGSRLDELPPDRRLGGRRRAALLDRAVEVPVNDHETAKYRALFEAITGEQLSEGRPEIALDDQTRTAAAAAARSLGLEPGHYVFACPAGTVTVPLKAWPVDQFVEVARHLDHHHDLPLLLTGVPDEAPLLDAARDACARAGVRARVWIGEPGSLGLFLGLIAGSRLYVGNDTGPMHCAAALDVPVVSRFGGGHWPRFLPVARRSFTATQHLPCFGCGWQCWLDRPACMTAIDSATFIKGIDWVLAGTEQDQRVDTGSALDAPLTAVFEAAVRTTTQLARAAPPLEQPAAGVKALTSPRPRVFVVTPSYNQGRYLRQTIESVLSQDYPNIEYLVADGGSTDDSVKILKSYGDRIRWTSGPDGGQAAAIADAWASTDADIVAWLNSDDTYLDGAVSAVVDYLIEHPGASMVYGQAWYTDATGRPTRPYPSRPFDRQALAGDCFICQPATFVRRDVFKIVALPDRSLRFVMDYDLWIRISQHFQAGYFDRFLATSRLHAQNKTLRERGGLIREAAHVSRRHFGSLHPAWALEYAQHRIARATQRLRRLPRPLREWVTERVTTALARSVEAPPFDDGWVGPRALVLVDCDETRWVTIEGDVPEWPYRGSVRITATCNGRVLDARQVRGPSVFTLTFRLPSDVAGRAAVQLDSSRSFAPMRQGLTADPRVLAFRIRRITTGPPTSDVDRLRANRIARGSRLLRVLPLWLQRPTSVILAGASSAVEGGPFKDGWVGHRTQVSIEPDADGRATIDGDCPQWPYAVPLCVSVHYDSVVLTAETVPAGARFSLTFQIPGRPSGPVNILLVANRSFVPREHGFSDDSRHISFMLLAPSASARA